MFQNYLLPFMVKILAPRILAISLVSFNSSLHSLFNSVGKRLASIITDNQNFDSLVDFKAIEK